MTLDDWQLVLPVLGLIAYITLTAILRTLANLHRWETEVHGKIVASRRLRAQYLASVAMRKGINVDIL